MDKNDGYLNSNTVNFPYQNFLVPALYSCIKNLLLTLILLLLCYFLNAEQGPSWSWSYGSWIYNYLCNQCLSPLNLWARVMVMVFNTTMFQQYFSYIVAVSFIGGGNRSTWRKPTTCHKSLPNFII
jgi:hypothetical protein